MTVLVPTVADFGPLIIETDVDDAVIATLKTWLPGYLSKFEDERSLGRDFFPRPVAASYNNALDDDEFPDHILPAIIVTTAETDAQPTKDGEGRYQAAWKTTVSAITRGQRPSETRRNAASFGGTIRRVLEQQQDLGGFASEVVWGGSQVRAVADKTNAGRYLARGTNTFTIWTENVLSEKDGPWIGDSGPYTPPDPTDPNQTYDPPLEVERVGFAVDALPIDQT